MKILIVDDKEEERYLAETLLKGSGYDVVTAANGAEALEKLRTEGFDMIVSDILMPVMDGFQLCKECKEDEKLRDIPFVFSTAEYVEEEDKNLGLKLGVAKFIRKPIEPDEFIKLIQGIFKDIEEGEKKPVTAGMKILVVEDNEDSRNLLVKQLRAYGHEVMATADGAEALEQALAQPPDIIVSDILMPKMDGYQLCRECKLNEQLKNIPFVFYTATYTLDEDRKFALSLGADTFIVKPAEPDSLVQTLCEIFEKAKSGALAPAEVVPLEPSLFLTEHAKRVSAKLEDKVAQLEREITERKQAEETLQIAEQNFRNSLDNSPLGIRIVTVEGELLYANQAILDIYGYGSVEELKAMPAKQRYTPESYAEHQERKERRKLGKPVPSSYEISIIRKDREIRHLIVSRKEVVWGGEVQYQVIYQDITERKQAEHDLNERVKELRCLYGIANIAERPAITFNELYQEVANLLPPSWQYPEIACCRITINDKEYRTNNYRETAWKQAADIKVHNVVVGEVEVNYLEERPELDEGPFSKEERQLIDAVAERLGRITEGKRAEEELRESERRYRLLAENAEDVIWTVDMNMRPTYMSPSITRLLGYSVEEAMALPMEVVYAPASFETAMKVLAEELAIENMEQKDLFRSRTLELELNRKDGSIVPVEVKFSFIREPDGRPVKILAIARDITERKRAEEALRRSEVSLAQAQQIAHLGNWVWDITNNTLRWSDEIYRIFGLEPQQFGATYEAFLNSVHPDDRESVQKSVDEALYENKPYSIEHRIILPDGSVRVVHEQGAVTFDESRRPTRMVGTIQDITERRKMEEQLMVTDRLASIGELASGIAHELNNPLTSVIGFSDLLLGKKGLPSDVKEDLKVINREAQRTASVVRNLLTFARKHAPTKEPVAINNLIQKVLELRAYEQKVENIEVNTRFAPDLPKITADGFQLQQVFLNIIINAEHFMSEAHGRGTLNITTERVRDIIRASFADDGPGIAKENLGHVFDPFFTTKEVGKGTGLGLSISYGIITEHGGRIYAESKLGKGVTFIVELPVSQQ